MSVSLSNVARHAGVSIATASRVVSGSNYPVSDELRLRVEQAVRDLNYKPNALARALAEQRSRIIGVIISDVTDPYFAEIARGVDDWARQADYLTIICNADRNLTTELAYLNILQEHHCEGIILAGGMYTDVEEAEHLRNAVVELQAHGTKVVVLADRMIESTPVITVDNEGILFDLTSYLVRRGHRRIVYVNGPEHFTTAKLRLDGYLMACQKADLEPIVHPGGFNFEDGRAAAVRLLKDPLPDAIIASSDESAIGVLVTLRQAGIKVPEQVSVAGVDDIRYAIAADLTTVEVPIYELGAMAAKLLVDEDKESPRRIVLPHRLVIRGTTSRANQPTS